MNIFQGLRWSQAQAPSRSTGSFEQKSRARTANTYVIWQNKNLYIFPPGTLDIDSI